MGKLQMPRRRNTLRLQNYDYSASGAYFVTVCSHERACLFGSVVDGAMRSNHAGQMVETVWRDMPNHYAGVDVDIFVVMPNHIHGIVILVGATPCGCPKTGQAQGPAPTVGMMSLSDVVHRFKTMTTKRYADGVKQYGWPRFRGRLWQRNYYEHIIRHDESLNRIRQYIMTNPGKWDQDRENLHG